MTAPRQPARRTTPGHAQSEPGTAYADFMSKAYAMELDASERYAEFADQMEVHNNPDVAQLFRKLSGIEGLHASRIREEMGWTQTPYPMHPGPWTGGEPPETAQVTDLHYLMHPYHALEIALNNEERAEAFFTRLASARETPAEVRKLAEEMAAEEAGHQRLIQEWMARVPKPGPDWNRDPDPPVLGD